jgi:hypothetical protein
MDKQRKSNKQNFEKPFTSLEKLRTRIGVGAKFLEMYTLIEFSVIYGMECKS